MGPPYAKFGTQTKFHLNSTFMLLSVKNSFKLLQQIKYKLPITNRHNSSPFNHRVSSYCFHNVNRKLQIYKNKRSLNTNSYNYYHSVLQGLYRLLFPVKIQNIVSLYFFLLQIEKVDLSMCDICSKVRFRRFLQHHQARRTY